MGALPVSPRVEACARGGPGGGHRRHRRLGVMVPRLSSRTPLKNAIGIRISFNFFLYGIILAPDTDCDDSCWKRRAGDPTSPTIATSRMNAHI